MRRRSHAGAAPWIVSPWIVSLAATLALLPAAGTSPARPAPGPQGMPAPAPGRLLVAREGLRDPYFGRTVVLLTRHGPRGTVGLILNRPLHPTLGEALAGGGKLPPAARAARLRFGGPVARRLLTVLARGGRAGKEGPLGLRMAVGDEALELLREAAEAGRPFRAYAGYAGWAPGQLARELRRGDWLVAPGDPQAVFSEEGEALWRRLLRRWSDPWLEARPRLHPGLSPTEGSPMGRLTGRPMTSRGGAGAGAAPARPPGAAAAPPAGPAAARPARTPSPTSS